MSAAGKSIGHNSAAEVITGLVVVAVAALLLVFFYSRAGAGSGSGYEILAKVARVDGLGVGTDVDLSGIKVGEVTALTLDPNNFLVTVHMNIRNDVQIPEDSSMQVTQVGFLGGQYVAIQPGGDQKNLAPGGMISNAQGSVDLMTLLGRAALGGTTDSAPASKPQQQPQGAAPPSP
jgi:phospholipid/cholesterol/gamma-HCH transport system substrate-binding protein